MRIWDWAQASCSIKGTIMTKRRKLGIAVMVLGILPPAACEQTLRTGKVGNTTNAPASDGTCPSGLTVCGKGAFAHCLDLQNDRANCGFCDNSCLLGIACTAGACQQVACTGPVTVSTQALTGSTVATSMGGVYVGALLADINGDGHPDLVTWASGEGTFQVALGEAGGGFGAATSYQGSNEVDFIVAGDSNADGSQDLYVNNMLGSPCVQIWLGHKDGKLTPVPDTGVPGCLGTIAIADLNGDGSMDLVTTVGGTSGPTVFLADANGAFHAGTTYPARLGSPPSILVRDWNGDGAPDLVTLGWVLALYINKGNGTFENEMNCGIYTPAMDQVVIADFNRDGHMDVAASMGYIVGVVLGMGGCQFQPMSEYSLSGSISALVQGDVNGDGIEDLVAETSDGNIFLLRGVADGTFQVVQLSTGSVPGESSMLLVGEVTGDGKADIVLVPGPVPTQIVISGTGPAQLVDAGIAPSQILENTCP
jgi:hypothetical protein